MSDENEKTIETYEQGIEAYNAAALPSVIGSVKDWVDASLTHIPQGGLVLEIGSAHGRDADYIESKGYRVDRTDVVKSFVEYMKSKGKDARILNALTDDIGGEYDMVYANAVLLHFNAEEIKSLLHKIRKSLKPDGVFSFSVKIGEGSSWSESKLDAPRYFTYWREDELREMLSEADLSVIFWEEGSTGHDNSDRYHVIVRKSESSK